MRGFFVVWAIEKERMAIVLLLDNIQIIKGGLSVNEMQEFAKKIKFAIMLKQYGNDKTQFFGEE